MSATFRLFERWKASKGHESNNAAALALGTTRQTVQNWKDGRNGEAHYIERMCADLGEDPVPVVLEAFAEASRDAEARRALLRLSRRFRASAVGLALALAGALGVAPAPSHAATGPIRGPGDYSLCEQRRRLNRRFLSNARPLKRSYSAWTYRTRRPALSCSA